MQEFFAVPYSIDRWRDRNDHTRSSKQVADGRNAFTGERYLTLDTLP